MVRKGLGVDPEDVTLVVAWLERYRPQQPVSLPEALNKALRDKGGPSVGTVNNPSGNNQYRKQDNFDNYQSYPLEESKQQQSIGGGGTSAAYTVARLQRDEPALYGRVQRGELSANAAAIEAGWRKQQDRYSLPNDPTAAGRYLAQRVDKEWLQAMVDVYMKAGACGYLRARGSDDLFGSTPLSMLQLPQTKRERSASLVGQWERSPAKLCSFLVLIVMTNLMFVKCARLPYSLHGERAHHTSQRCDVRGRFVLATSC